MSFKKTGDIKGNTESLIRNLKTINYPSQTSYKILTSGNPGIYLPIIHYSLFNYSPIVAKFLSDKHYDMFAKNDLDFINTAFHCLITLFNYKPELSTEQFFSNKFVEGKVILCKEIIDIVIQKNNELSNKKKKGINKNMNRNNNNNGNNISPKFHELNSSKNSKGNKNSNNINNNSKQNSYKKNNNSNNNSSINNNSNFENSNNNENSGSINDNQINEYNNINNNFNASLPMNNIPVPTPKPSFFISKNVDNIQSSVQSFKPKSNTNMGQNMQLEVYDSSQEYPLSGQNNNNNSINNSNSNSMDFNSIVKIITSLSESVSVMVNKVETFKGNIEDRLNKLEAEIVLIKNKQNYLDSRLNNNNINNNEENKIKNSNDIFNNNNNKEKIMNKNNYNQINNINIELNEKRNNINNIIGNENNINQYYPNSKNKNNNIYFQDSSNYNNDYLKNNQIFTSFAPEIRTNPGPNFESNNNINNKMQYNNIFEYNQSNDNYINDKNKYADIDKLIENSEKNFFKTQKLLEDYEKK